MTITKYLLDTLSFQDAISTFEGEELIKLNRLKSSNPSQWMHVIDERANDIIKADKLMKKRLRLRIRSEKLLYKR